MLHTALGLLHHQAPWVVTELVKRRIPCCSSLRFVHRLFTKFIHKLVQSHGLVSSCVANHLPLVTGAQLSLPPCEHIDKWVAMSSVERSFYERLHKQVISTQAQHQASQKSRRSAASSRNPARSVFPCSSDSYSL